MTDMSRRQMLQTLGLSAAGAALSGFMPQLAEAFSGDPKRQRHCILLWMPGGASQVDTFDMKPAHPNGGEFKPIATSIPGIKISEHLPKLAQQMEHMAIVRSLSTAEGDHSRGTYLMHTGHRPGGPISYPTIGASLSKAMANESTLPNFISISPYTAFNNAAFGPGFLGPRHAPLTVGATNAFVPQQAQNQAGYAQLGVDDLRHPGLESVEQDARIRLWKSLQEKFLATHQSDSPKAQNTVYERALKLMKSEAAKAFDLSGESASVRDAYGRGRFGQGCLMARRLIEQGVPFIEISLRGTAGGALGWDTHQQNFSRVKSLSSELDAGWATLMSELSDRGLLENTTIIWLGEFGRTPKLAQGRAGGGRDHFPRAWSTVLAGGGIKGGRVFGKTNDGGEEVIDGKVDVPDVLATLCRALGVDPDEQNLAELGRPIRIAEGKPIEAIL